jgi:hypothetical protein
MGLYCWRGQNWFLSVVSGPWSVAGRMAWLHHCCGMGVEAQGVVETEGWKAGASTPPLRGHVPLSRMGWPTFNTLVFIFSGGLSQRRGGAEGTRRRFLTQMREALRGNVKKIWPDVCGKHVA